MKKLTKATMRELGRYSALTLSVAVSVFILGWILTNMAIFKNTPSPVTADEQGEFLLFAQSAKILGTGSARREQYAGQKNIGYWDSSSQWLAWDVDIEAVGKYQVALHYARPRLEVEMEINVGKSTLPFKLAATGGWDKWKKVTLGTIDISSATEQELTLKATRLKTEGVINFVSLKLTPIK